MIWLQQNRTGFCYWLRRVGLWLNGERPAELYSATLSGAEPIRVPVNIPTDISIDISIESNLRSQGIWDNSAAHESSYWATSSAPAETLWQLLTDLADLASWHPLITSTNAPRGQRAKPGLIYRTCSRYLPLSTQIFVERVLPGELISIRLFPLPGLQERVTYRIISTLCGTCVLYSMTLSGWLSPIAWPMMKPQVTKVAAALVQAAEEAAMRPHDSSKRLQKLTSKTDIF